MTTNDENGLWEPATIPTEVFHKGDEWININRAPLDVAFGVIYKRAVAIKRVEYEPLDPAPERLEPWQGNGKAVIRWLFSEQPETAEHLLDGATFAYLHDLTLTPGSATGHVMHDNLHEVIYVISGEGIMHHHGVDSPFVARPLRGGDAVIIQAGEYHSVANPHQSADLRLFVLGLYRSPA